MVAAYEWVGKKGYLQRAVVLNKDLRQIQVLGLEGQMLHHVKLTLGSSQVKAFRSTNKFHIMISVTNAHDLVNNHLLRTKLSAKLHSRCRFLSLTAYL